MGAFAPNLPSQQVLTVSEFLILGKLLADGYWVCIVGFAKKAMVAAFCSLDFQSERVRARSPNYMMAYFPFN